MKGCKWPTMGISLLLFVLALPGYNMLTNKHAHKHSRVGGNVHLGPVSANASLSLGLDTCALTYCGPLSTCTPGKYVGKCACAPGAEGKPPFCRHPCTYDVNCAKDQVCVNNTCVDPCDNACGENALCHLDPSCDGLLGDGLTAHAVHTLALSPCKRLPVCSCPEKFVGDGSTACVAESPCDEETNPCGANSACQAVKGRAVCTCQDGFTGSPPSCKHECEQNEDCPSGRGCVGNKCVDPCAGACGPEELCHVEDREAVCSQPQCDAEATEEPPAMRNPCDPNPCGRNSNCAPDNGNAMCSCKFGFKGPPPNCVKPCDVWPCGDDSLCIDYQGVALCSCYNKYKGQPPNCHLQCATDKNCPSSDSCVNGQCVSLCKGAICASNAYCIVRNREPVCRCPGKLQGDPKVNCENNAKIEM